MLSKSAIDTLVVIADAGSDGFARYTTNSDGSYSANHKKGHNDNSVQTLVKAGLVEIKNGTEFLTPAGKRAANNVYKNRAIKDAKPENRIGILRNWGK